MGANKSLSKPKRFKEGVKSVDEEESTDEESAIMSEFDYHDTINSENYEKYFEKVCQLLNPILDGVRAYPILDGGGGQKSQTVR